MIKVVEVNFGACFGTSGFSLYNWKLKKGLEPRSSELEDPFILQLMEELGIAAYSKSPMCTISPSNSAGRVNGWTTGIAAVTCIH